MKQLNEHIKKSSFKNIYLLYGNESYLTKFYKGKFRDSIIGKDDTMNYSYFEGKNIDFDQVLGIAETLPFFAERRLIIIENSGLFKSDKKDIAEKLTKFFATMSPTTYIIFLEEELDKRGKLYKAVADKGYATELKGLNEKDLVLWLLQKVKKDGKNITEQSLLHFVHVVGVDMENLESEMEKLLCYTMEKDVIEVVDIDEIATTQVTNKIFDMINAVADKKQQKALDLYNDLRILKEPPMRILFMIVRQFNILIQVKQLSRKGMESKEIASQTRLHPFVVSQGLKQAKKFEDKQLMEALEACMAAEADVKQGRMGDQMTIELLIIKLSTQDSK